MGFRMFATRTDEIVTDHRQASARTIAGVTGPAAFGQPKWALNGTVSYDRENWGLSMQARYIDSGLYNVDVDRPERPALQPVRRRTPRSKALMVNDNTIDSATYLTLSGRYRLPMRNERSWELFATINNALDEDPPLAPDGAYPDQRGILRPDRPLVPLRASAATSAAATTISGGRMPALA